MTVSKILKLKSEKADYRSSMIESKSVGSIIADIVLIIILLIIAFVCTIPLWHSLMSSLSNGQLLFGHDGLVVWPIGEPTLEGYRLILQDNNIIRGYTNTLIYVAGNIAAGFVLNTLGGYVLSRKTKLKSLLTIFVVFTMLFSGGIVPLYMVVRSLGMVGTRWALILPHCTNGAFIVMMIKAFDSVPEETVESARIDGAGHIRVMFQIMLPQCFNFALVTMVNTGIIAWNAWMSAAIYVPTDKSRWPLQLWVRDIVARNQDFLNWTNPDFNRYLVQYSVIILATLPLLLLFPFFLKRLEKGMAKGAVKG